MRSVLGFPLYSVLARYSFDLHRRVNSKHSSLVHSVNERVNLTNGSVLGLSGRVVRQSGRLLRLGKGTYQFRSHVGVLKNSIFGNVTSVAGKRIPLASDSSGSRGGRRTCRSNGHGRILFRHVRMVRVRVGK